MTSGWLGFSHGANDAQKAVGVLAVLLLANGSTTLAVGAGLGHGGAAALTLGTALGGWRIVKTIRTPHLPHPAAGRPGQPDELGGRDPGRLGDRRPGQHHPGGLVLGRRGRVGRRRYHHIGWEVVGSILLAGHHLRRRRLAALFVHCGG